MNNGLVVTLLVSGILYGTPILFAALGEILTERSGVINLGVEGMMLMGAVCGFWVSQSLRTPGWVALVLALGAAAAAGALMATIHAFLTITLRADQIVSGVALTIFGGAIGLSSFIGTSAKLPNHAGRHVFASLNVFGLKNLPILGPILFHQNALIYASWVVTATVGYYIYRSRRGLRLRAVGEDAGAADALGINVPRYRYVHTIIGGALAGVGGAAYSLALSPEWSAGLTAGVGWIAIGLVIFSFWRPVFALVGAYAFGVVASLGFNLQARGVNLPPELFSSLPYLLTIVVLVIVSATWGKRLGAPAALGTPYAREGARDD